MTTPNDDFVEAWNRWHSARLRAVTSPLGLAALAATHWLEKEPRALEGVPGVWSVEGTVGLGDAAIRGEAPELVGSSVLQDGRPLEPIASGSVRLLAGQDVEWGDIRLRYFERDGSLALRVIDPSTPGRTTLRDIDAFDPDPDAVVPGKFVPASAGDSVQLTAIDGHIGTEPVAGFVEFTYANQRARLLVAGGPNGLAAIIGDSTSGDETYGFRFLSIQPPDAEHNVVVDLNRAYLPPCALSDFYVCQMPPPGNRMDFPIRAGEKQVVRWA